jgi:hypothetical protein
MQVVTIKHRRIWGSLSANWQVQLVAGVSKHWLLPSFQFFTTLSVEQSLPQWRACKLGRWKRTHLQGSASEPPRTRAHNQTCPALEATTFINHKPNGVLTFLALSVTKPMSL